MSTKSRSHLYGVSHRIAVDKAREARQVADDLACREWNLRMRCYNGPAQPSPTIGDAMNGGFGFLEVKCRGCQSYIAIDLTIVRQPADIPIWRLERWMRCKWCSEQRGYPFKQATLVRLRRSKVTVESAGQDDDY